MGSKFAREYNRGCFSSCSGLIAGVLGGATAAVVFTIISIALSVLLCVAALLALSYIINESDAAPNVPNGYTERSLLMLNPNEKPDTIRTNVPGGNLRMNQSIDPTSLQFTPDPDIIGKSIRVYDASKKYGVAQSTITQWADAGIVAIIERGPKLLMLDESTVARAAAIFKKARELTTPRRAAWILKRAVSV